MTLSERILATFESSGVETLDEVIEAVKEDLLNLCEDNEEMQIAILQYFGGEDE